MIHFTIKEDGPPPRLQEVVARQKAEGGYIIQYGRAWSALVVMQMQHRVEHVHFGRSRVLPGLKHSLFTLGLGIWSPYGLLTAPMFLILNFRGGMDVTADYSTTSLDPMRDLPPVPGQGQQDLRRAQWTYVALGAVAVLWAIWYCTMHVWK